jgi:arylsulfatase A-like enzyme
MQKLSLLLCALFSALFIQSSQGGERPNIILVMADDLGYGDLGCYGNEMVKTPHLDALARTGVRCTDFHSNGVVCSPTRAAFFTGKYQQRTGITGVVKAASMRDVGLGLDEWTMGEAMQDLGYATGMFGKWHLGYDPKFNPVQHGFDAYRGFVSGNVDYHRHIDQAGFKDWYVQDVLTEEEGYVTDVITRDTLAFIEKNKEKPFMAVVMHGAPHYPYQGRESAGFRKLGKVSKKQKMSKKERESLYVEMIEAMDDGVGEIVKKLDQLGIRENTLIVFCADNGHAEVGSGGGFRGRKGQLHEGGHRVPGIFHWKGNLEAGECSVPLMTFDLLPTFVALGGGEIEEERKVDGENVLPVLKGEGAFQREALFWQFKDMRAVRKGEWKLLEQGSDAELYDLGKDLAEKNNLAKQYPERVKELQRMLDAWEREVAP